MSNEFTNINSIEGWKMKLEELVGAAASIARTSSGNTDQIVTLSDRLVGFITHSTPDNSPAIQEMDDIARKTRNDLIRSRIEERLAGITERTNELAILDKKIRAITAEGQRQAAAIRLERAKAVVQSLTDTISSLKTFRSILKDGTDDALAKSVEEILTTIQNLRAKVEESS
jgi:hypothetical protein